LNLFGRFTQAGSGILNMIARGKQAGLPAPEFRQEGGQFVQRLWRPNPAVTPQVTPQVDSGRNLLKTNHYKNSPTRLA